MTRPSPRRTAGGPTIRAQPQWPGTSTSILTCALLFDEASLADHTGLLVAWRVTDDVDAARTETAMLADFRAHYGRLPFANMRG